jgi:hypothetical protein
VVTTLLAKPANIVVPSGATLGTVNAVECPLTVGVMNVDGVAELFVVNSKSIVAGALNESSLITTTILDAASDSQNVAYSNTARTNMPYRILGQITSTQATAGTWATAPSIIQGVGGLVMPKRLLQNLNVTTGAVATGTTVIPADNTIPQITEGDQYMTLAIFPTSTTSKLEVSVVTQACHDTAERFIIVALFRDAVANALAATEAFSSTAYGGTNSTLFFTMTSGTKSEIIFRIRMGGHAAGTQTFNGQGSGRIFGGVMASSITIKEYAA